MASDIDNEGLRRRGTPDRVSRMVNDRLYWEPGNDSGYIQRGGYWGETGPSIMTRGGATEDGPEWAQETPNRVTVNGVSYERIGDWHDEKGNPIVPEWARGYGFEQQIIYDPKWGLLIPSATKKEIDKLDPRKDFFADYGPYLALIGMAAGPMATSMGLYGGTNALLTGLDDLAFTNAGVDVASFGSGADLASGLNALNSFDTGEMAKILGTDLSTTEKVTAAIQNAISTPGVSTAQKIADMVKSATGIDIPASAISTLGKLGISALVASGAGSGSGGSGMGSTANDAFALAREQWAWNKARAEEIWPQTKELIQQQLDIGRTNAARAKSEWDTYQRLYLPAEQRYVQEMSNWDTPERRTARIQEATADVAKGYDAARGQLERGLTRSGVRIGGSGYTQAMADLARAQAADIAGAQNNARRQVEAEGIAGLERVTNIGRGRPSTSFAADQLALSAGNSANANVNQNTAATNAGLSAAQGWFNTGVNAQNLDYRNRADSSAGIGKLLGQLFFDGSFFADGGLVRRKLNGPRVYADGGLVRRAQRKLEKNGLLMPFGMHFGLAKGGMVYGPGTETSDSIPAVIDGQEPAALSTGEAVLNADAVEIVGQDFIERINQAGLERRQRRGGGQTIEGEARRVA